MSRSRGPISSTALPTRPCGSTCDAVRNEIEPDPMFRRRLRGAAMNRFVAEREGAVAMATPRSSRMGRLGRACLYASVATALGVGGVMAASESAIPGDFLYPLKRSVEEMRATVAPAHLRDELAVHALAERVDEVGRLIQSGDMARSASLSIAISASLEAMAAKDWPIDTGDRLAAQLERLQAVLDNAPVRARRAVERVMSGIQGFQAQPGKAADVGTSGEGVGPRQRAAGGVGGRRGDRCPEGTTKQPSDKERASQPQRSPWPERTQRPTRSPTPSGSVGSQHQKTGQRRTSAPSLPGAG